jgi:hypothetical protein
MTESTTHLADQLRAKFPPVGEKIEIETGQDIHGQWYWRETIRSDHTLHGPFRTKREAQKDSEVTVLGPQCKITEGGQWNPAWDRVQ